ncbi:MAG: hypothetical protein NKF70_02780 [Methanobacterium sp. ERen5]|nr:MAG: hypothetical protein NKF70_02780 [Methanobacterium sp. ERen5]
MKKKFDECPDILYHNIPAGWLCREIIETGPFITGALLISPEGLEYKWRSRFHRKHHNLLDSGTISTWFAPGAIAWWIGVLFAVGSLLFVLGSAPSYINWAGPHTDTMTYLLGSIFFTTAAFLQYIETVNIMRVPMSMNIVDEIKVFTWEPRRIDWVSSVVQLIGTIFFNLSTFFAVNLLLTVQQVNHQVWVPDIYGSICFLIASSLVWIEVGHGVVSFDWKNISWHIALLNLMGSVAFGISAIYAFILPATGEPVNFAIQNWGTFVGGVCFLIAAVLLLPERTMDQT